LIMAACLAICALACASAGGIGGVGGVIIGFPVGLECVLLLLLGH
jgi:hypothetical protein